MTMPDLWSLLSAPFVELLGWVLLHFVWQGALVALGLAGALFVLRTHAPTLRYAVGCVALVSVLALPIGTGVYLGDSLLGTSSTSVVTVERAADASTLPSLAAAEATGSTSPTLHTRAAAWLEPMLPWIVMGWAVGVLLFSIRLAGGAWRVRRLRRESTPGPTQWRDRLRALADRLGLRHVPALRISDRVDGPMVAGWWRPVILVPVGLLSGLPPEQVEALLLHELAHVRRHDVLVGRLQAVVETLLFFHPATWWISRQVRQTREACCDDLAVQAGTDRTIYVRALATLAERTVATPRPTGTLAASDGSLLARVRRLLAPTATPSTNAQRLSMAVALFLLVAVPLGVVACASQQSATEPEAEESVPSSERLEPSKTAPPAPDAEPEDPAVVMVQDDSVRRVVMIRGDEGVEIDSLDDAGYVLRYEGERLDTIDVPRPKSIVRPDSFRHELPMRLAPDSLKSILRGRINADSIERVLRLQLKPDTLERALQMQFDPDDLEQRARQLRLRSDSLERVFRSRFNPDSLERAFRERYDPDSLR